MIMYMYLYIVYFVITVIAVSFNEHSFIISRCAEGPGREILKRPPSVCPYVCHYCIFSKLVHAPCHGGGGGAV